MTNQRQPFLKAVVLADRVYTDGATGKSIIAGTFEHVTTANYPAVWAQGAWVYIALRDLSGETTIELAFQAAGSGKPLWTLTVKGNAPADPLATSEFAVQLPQLVFPEPGLYEIELRGNGHFLGTCPIHALTPKDNP